MATWVHREWIPARCPVSGVRPPDLNLVSLFATSWPIQITQKRCAPFLFNKVIIKCAPRFWGWLCRWNETSYMECTVQSLALRTHSTKVQMLWLLSSSSSSFSYSNLTFMIHLEFIRDTIERPISCSCRRDAYGSSNRCGRKAELSRRFLGPSPPHQNQEHRLHSPWSWNFAYFCPTIYLSQSPVCSHGEETLFLIVPLILPTYLRTPS